MNRLENYFCGSRLWHNITRGQLLPWLLDGIQLGDCVLELGAGAGAATAELAKKTAMVTSVDIDANLLKKLRAKMPLGNTVRGDATRLPFQSQTFASVVAILMLHHLASREMQKKAFAEIGRVLKPGGRFLVLEIADGWLPRLTHFRSTFVPLLPSEFSATLGVMGFSDVRVTERSEGFRARAIRSH